jgi:hypothetical protein
MAKITVRMDNGWYYEVSRTSSGETLATADEAERWFSDLLGCESEGVCAEADDGTSLVAKHIATYEVVE